MKHYNLTTGIRTDLGHEQCAPLHRFGPAIREYHLLHFILKGKGRFLTEDGAFSLKEGEGFYTEMLDGEFSADEVGRITKMRVARMSLSDNGDAVFDECVKALKDAALDEKNKNGLTTMADLDALLKKKRGLASRTVTENMYVVLRH